MMAFISLPSFAPKEVTSTRVFFFLLVVAALLSALNNNMVVVGLLGLLLASSYQKSSSLLAEDERVCVFVTQVPKKCDIFVCQFMHCQKEADRGS